MCIRDSITRALDSLAAVGLGYLTLGQAATELSGGEAQRIKLATELQRAPRGHTVYLLDEPTTGLHPADVDLLLAELSRLVDQGGTVVLVEHDMRVVAVADHVIDLGPGAGEHGGRIIAAGTPAEVAAAGTATGRCLALGTKTGDAQAGISGARPAVAPTDPTGAAPDEHPEPDTVEAP